MINYLSDGIYVVAVAVYFAAAVLYVSVGLRERKPMAGAAFGVMALGLLFHGAALVGRAMEAGRPPFTNMYEFTSLFAFGSALVFLVAERRRAVKNLGLFVAPLIFLLAAAALLFPSNVTPIMPALQSGWLHFHVVTAIIAYGAFTVSFGAAVMYLIRAGADGQGNRGSGLATRLPDADKLDHFIYASISFAFPFLTLVIVTGAIWAEQAWGSYWHWDPKETWSLITWIIYAVYLHARLVAGWQGRRSAWMAVVGFVAVLFTYFGVNLVLASIHSYV